MEPRRLHAPIGQHHTVNPLACTASASRLVVPDVVELRTSYNTGALWGFLSWMPHSSLLFASLSVLAGFAICYWLFVRKAAADARLTYGPDPNQFGDLRLPKTGKPAPVIREIHIYPARPIGEIAISCKRLAPNIYLIAIARRRLGNRGAAAATSSKKKARMTR